MKRLPWIFALLVLSPAFAQGAAPPADWKEFSPLIGAWIADPPSPDTGVRGGFTLETALSGRVLVRKNWAEYPPSKDRSASRHDDLMVVYREGSGVRADYYDNEGHVIRYGVSVPTPGNYVFLGDPREGQPRFRLTQSIDAAGALSILFEIAPPGASNDFKPFIKATAHKKS